MKNLSAVYFSPTGGTRKAVLNLAAGMGGDIEEVGYPMERRRKR